MAYINPFEESVIQFRKTVEAVGEETAIEVLSSAYHVLKHCTTGQEKALVMLFMIRSLGQIPNTEEEESVSEFMEYNQKALDDFFKEA